MNVRWSLTGVMVATVVLVGGGSAAVGEATQPSELGTALCFGEVPTLVGAPGQHQMNGTSGYDVMLAGPDTGEIRGLGGDDLICDLPGGDINLRGGDGNDSLRGGGLLYSGDGSDLLVGDSAFGGTAFLLGGKGNDRYRGGPGTDTFSTGQGSDRVVGTSGPCNPRAYTCDILEFYPYTTRSIVGDLRDGFIRTGPDRVRLVNLRIVDVAVQGDGVVSGEYSLIRGSALSEWIIFSGDRVRLYGRAGDDWLELGRGEYRDRVIGGTGNDRLRSGMGDDVVRGGAGDDVNNAGPGDHDVCIDEIGDNTFIGCERR
jgi:Ca2+-binding RTX toxin-like protein